ncbi:MAG: polysaccharide pyruvyl transferase family protein [Rhodobacteraceae bacterium]|nr:polysaccharide pyruvyl transferase family protein [Paracoccaceae bacterium]MCW9042297.1 polysaccharide pyruvyl transferase family protein [Pseudopelagicola sp.]
MKRIAIINFTGFRGNWGCQATSIELVKFIAGCFPQDEALKFHFVPLLPSSRVDVEYDRDLDRVFAAFSDVAAGTDRAASSLAYLTRACEARYGVWAEHVRNADLVVFQAEGSMGMGANFTRGPRLMLLPFVAKHAWGRRVVSMNQSFYSHEEIIRKNAAEAFGSFDFSAFREGASVALARASGVAQAAYVPDVAFLSPRGPAMTPDPIGDEAGYFAVSGSALKDPRRYEYIMAQAEAIREATGLKPILALSRDYKMTLRAMMKWPRGSYARIPSDARYAQVTGVFARCRFLLSGRYHMSILSAAAGTPNVILTGNSFKNEGLVSLLGMTRPVHGFADTDAIVAEALAVNANQEAERAALEAQVGRIRETLRAAQVHVAKIIAGETPGAFVDTLPPYDLKSEVLDRYYAHGRGKGSKPVKAWPGRRLGRERPMRDILEPLLDGIAQDGPATLATLKRMAAADVDFATALEARAAGDPALQQALS